LYDQGRIISSSSQSQICGVDESSNFAPAYDTSPQRKQGEPCLRCGLVKEFFHEQ
jgi:hypothetical protein